MTAVDKMSRLEGVEMETQPDVITNAETSPDGNTNALYRLIDKLTDILLGRRKPVISPSSVIETSKAKQEIQESESVNGNSYGTFEDTDEKNTCILLSKRIFDALRTAKQVKLDCEMFIPCDLTMRIAQDMLRMSHCEPCGIRGCIMYITMEDGGTSRKLGKIAVDPNTVATFEIYLVLQRINKFSVSLPTCLKFVPRDAITVSPGFKLVKNKLYRSQSHSPEE